MWQRAAPLAYCPYSGGINVGTDRKRRGKFWTKSTADAQLLSAVLARQTTGGAERQGGRLVGEERGKGRGGSKPAEEILWTCEVSNTDGLLPYL